ncbi:V-type ATP synthase subunit F [Lagierella sp.]|uniref:V-type ATP synthase subunit F n=1 Tax=Lagierella sp. TaxID=2849657 RepID=UPI0026158DDF|nr:V-type ATP synthase subunit F [Lagierella sp.]
MYSFLISNDESIVQGLKLAGIRGTYSKDKEELRNIFKKYLKDEKIGTLILTEEVSEVVSDLLVEHRKKRKSKPLIVVIPGQGGLKDPDFILKSVKESLGVKID